MCFEYYLPLQIGIIYGVQWSKHIISQIALSYIYRLFSRVLCLLILGCAKND